MPGSINPLDCLALVASFALKLIRYWRNILAESNGNGCKMASIDPLMLNQRNAMRAIRTILLLQLFCLAATTQITAQTDTDTVFEMPGVFRISLPQGWQKTAVIDDLHTVAAFSSKNMTLEVTRDLETNPAEKYVQTVPGMGIAVEWDEYPGKYEPAEVLSDPAYYKDYKNQIADRFDEYTLIGGMPALWSRYRVVYTKSSGETPAARAWTVFILSPGEYWSLKLRGDEHVWPAIDDDLQRMVRSFQFLEPTQARIKAEVPAEAWKRVPSSLPLGSCQFAGSASGIGAVVPCDTNVTFRQQGEPDENSIVGEEKLSIGGADLVFVHYVADWSAEDFSQQAEKIVADKLKGEKDGNVKASYKQNSKDQISVDGTPGTSIIATVQFKKAHEEGLQRLLTISKGTDHYYIECAYNRDNSDRITRVFDSIQLFGLHPQLSMVSSSDHGLAGIVQAILDRNHGNVSDLFNGPTAPQTAQQPKPTLKAPASPAAPPTSPALDRMREDVRLFNNSNSHFHLGKALDASGDHAGALTELETAVRINPRNFEADKEVAGMYATRNDPADAIAAYQRFLLYSALVDLDKDVEAQLATLYAKQGNTLFALFHLDGIGVGGPAIMLPDNEVAPDRKILADYATQIGAALKSEDEDPAPQNMQDSLHAGNLSIKSGDFAGADRSCRFVHAFDSGNVQAVACLTQAADARGEHDTIVGDALEWLTLSPNNPEAYYWLAHGYQWGPADYQKCGESYDAVIRNAMQGQLSLAMLHEARQFAGNCYAQAKDWKSAAVAYDSAVQANPNDAQILNDAGWFYSTADAKFRNPAKALDYAKRAVAAAPSNPNILDTLAEAESISGRIDDAVATEQKALALAPDRADLQKQLQNFKQAQQAKKKPQPLKK
jgi:tetratricopeptide (TPR) repeat protein